MRKVVAIGGSCIEICATSEGSFFHNDSCPGRVEFGLGGVARNVSEALCLFGENVSLITAVGDDSFGGVAIDRADEIGMKMLLEPFLGEHTGVYTYFTDNMGVFSGGVSDMGITDLITTRVIEENINAVLFSDYTVIETNLAEEVIKKIAGIDAKIVVDGVSGQKCKRMLSSIDRFHLVKMNKIEAVTMTGKTQREEILKSLADMGVRRGIITKRKEGAMCFEVRGGKIYTYDAENLANQPQNGSTNGCSDAFFAGFLHSYMNEGSMEDALYHGQAAAHINMQSTLPVNKALSRKKLSSVVGEFRRSVPIVRGIV